MSIVTSSGPRCTNEACEHREMSTASLQMQLESQIRGFISRFYEGWVTCDDSTCDYRTRMMSVSGHMCLRDKCGGRTSFEVCTLSIKGLLLITDFPNAVRRCDAIYAVAVLRVVI